MFEQICDFPYGVVVVCEYGPFWVFPFFCVFVYIVFNFVPQFVYCVGGVVIVLSYCGVGKPSPQ